MIARQDLASNPVNRRGLRRNPVISLSGQDLQGGNVKKEDLSSKRIELLQLAIRDGISQEFRIMAWGQPAPLRTLSRGQKFRGEERLGGRMSMESVHNQVCRNCGDRHLTVYFSDQTDDKLKVWCESCNLKAYYCGKKSVFIN
jgi:hypothetical protein